MSYPTLACLCDPRLGSYRARRRFRGMGRLGVAMPIHAIISKANQFPGGIIQGPVGGYPITNPIVGTEPWNWWTNPPAPTTTTGIGTTGQPSIPTNPTGQPSTIQNYDAYGNPIYAVPPPGQVVIGYDAAGNPIWGAPGSTSPEVVSAVTGAGTITGYDASGNPVYSAPPAGKVVTGYDAAGNPIYGTGAAALAAPVAGTVTGYDASGNPIYSTPPAGQVVIAYDASGNPIYGAPSTAPAAATTAGAAAPSVSVTSGDSYQSVLSWFTQSNLISGMPNWTILLGALLLLKMADKKGGLL